MRGVRDIIMGAAEQWFTDYGYGKTTMAEIIQGVAQGSLHVCDTRQTAYDIHQAMVCLKNNPLDVLASDLSCRLAAILFKGLAC